MNIYMPLCLLWEFSSISRAQEWNWVYHDENAFVWIADGEKDKVTRVGHPPVSTIVPTAFPLLLLAHCTDRDMSEWHWSSSSQLMSYLVQSLEKIYPGDFLRFCVCKVPLQALLTQMPCLFTSQRTSMKHMGTWIVASGSMSISYQGSSQWPNISYRHMQTQISTRVWSLQLLLCIQRCLYTVLIICHLQTEGEPDCYWGTEHCLPSHSNINMEQRSKSRNAYACCNASLFCWC
jgi:hypothetical protein